MKLIQEAFLLLEAEPASISNLKEQFISEGRYDGPDYKDGFGNRLGGASDEGESDPTPTSALYSVLDGKRVIKKDLPLKRAIAYAGAVRKSKPKADIKVQLQY